MTIDGIGSMPPMAPPPGMKPPSATEMSSEIISTNDTDGDGSLSIEEIGLSEENFDILDTNEDGVVSQDELVAKISEKLESMKEMMHSGQMRPDGPPPMGPPPGSASDETEDLTDLDQIVKMMNDIGTSMTDSPQSGVDMYSMVLEELGINTDEQASFFQILKNNATDYLA